MITLRKTSRFLFLAATLCTAFLSAMPHAGVENDLNSGHEDWKPILDPNLEEHSLLFDSDLSLSEEYSFPSEQKEAPKLFSLDEPLSNSKASETAQNETPPVPSAQNPSPATAAPAETQLSPLTPTTITPLAPKAAENIPSLTGAPQPAAPARSAADQGLPPVNLTTIPAAGTGTDATKNILINFNNVNIVEFIRFISRASNKNFLFDDADLQFNVTIVSEEPTSLQNVLTALMQVLRVHGLSLIEQGNNILIHRNKAINQVSQVVAEGLPQQPGGTQAELITRVFRLNTLDAEKAATIIHPLTSEGALVEVLKETSHLIVTDLATNVDKIGMLLKSLDAPNSGLTMGQYVVVNALLDSLISLAQQVMQPIAEGKPLVFVAHQPSNSVFVVSTPFLVDRSLAVLRTLDINVGETRVFGPESLRFQGGSQVPQPRSGPAIPSLAPGEQALSPGERAAQEAAQKAAQEQANKALPTGVLESVSPWTSNLPTGHIERTKFYIHKLRYRRGDQIVDALGKIGLSLQETGTGNLDLVSTIQSIQWLESSNSLVFTGTVASISKIKELIEEIDTPLRQVFIEMLILETDLTDSMNYGVNWGTRFNNMGDTAASQAFLTLPNPLSNAVNSAIPGGAFDPSPTAVTTGYNLGIIGRNVTHCGLSFDSIGAIVHALQDKHKDEIIMNPKILVEDNTTAEIFVGINTSFQTQAIANDQGSIITSNFEFRDVGTTLKVTPLISNNDMVTLDITEEVSSIAPTPTATGSLSNTSPGPTTRKSKTTTRVHVPNKFFLVMSGMIQDEYNRERLQVPCLGGAPLIGALFSEKRINDTKQNLMIFIRPQIIDTEEDIDNITRHQQDVYRQKTRTKKMWKYEVEEALDLLNIKKSDVSLHDSEQYNP